VHLPETFAGAVLVRCKLMHFVPIPCLLLRIISDSQNLIRLVMIIGP